MDISQCLRDATNILSSLYTISFYVNNVLKVILLPSKEAPAHHKNIDAYNLKVVK